MECWILYRWLGGYRPYGPRSLHPDEKVAEENSHDGNFTMAICYGIGGGPEDIGAEEGGSGRVG